MIRYLGSDSTPRKVILVSICLLLDRMYGVCSGGLFVSADTYVRIYTPLVKNHCSQVLASLRELIHGLFVLDFGTSAEPTRR